ncbi:proton extrusion protein PcxA [Leptolyngbya sp. 'hensonii']|uniref:proton extrusion protein PcxA n=1 Tax=Leptolyngbya sp. 'hensonii' TaxID=1922337 RepID=UPI00095009DD|nr:proton extrusion protein PcxA [Leptolyngbya sp. 'hensonii']OLP17630.1 proton extrusion protein PcxA [Leptolyngbya sp. 'hensonii']
MKKTPLANILGYLRSQAQWLVGTADRALDQAYDAALKIQAIEDEHFNGEKVPTESSQYSANVLAYFQGEVKKYQILAKVRLAEFRASNLFLNNSNRKALISESVGVNSDGRFSPGIPDRLSMVLEKLRFIDAVIDRYNQDPDLEVRPSNALTVVQADNPLPSPELASPKQVFSEQTETITDKTGVLPRSILGTVNRIKRELDPRSEEEVVRNFRNSKAKTVISIQLILLMIIVPLLAQQMSKSIVIGPIVDQIRGESEETVFLNYELEENAFSELQRFEEKLRFENLISPTIRYSPEEMEERVKERATQLAAKYREESNNAIKNVLADFLALLSFALVLVTNQRKIQILKSFIDEIVYGLSDSAKAFIIILFTDIFVGFHSPHGWEVILEGLSRHLGLPENRQFIFLFIATFPVILDTIFKYWIFRYLNRISPSAVATYKNMNE